jgi:hypothetical protein
MKRRDVSWRTGGAALLLLGFGMAVAMPPEAGPARSVLTLAGFLVVITGLVLVINGKRVAMVLRIERSRHRELPLAIHARRRGRR